MQTVSFVLVSQLACLMVYVIEHDPYNHRTSALLKGPSYEC